MLPLLLYHGRSNCAARIIRSPLYGRGGGSESDLVVLTNILNQDLSDYVGSMSSWWYLWLTMRWRPLPN
jgi:hypothetical protein